MARTDTLINFLTDVAAAIKAKKGDDTAIPAADFDTEIANLPSGGSDDLKDFIERNNIKNFTFPSGITKIGDGAFYNYTYLVITPLPSGITSIGNYAFNNCPRLALTSLPSGITSIGSFAFYGCTSLALTSLPSGITSIRGSAFSNCTGLTSITFEGTPKTMYSNIFNGCTNLTTINVPWAEGAVANAPWGAKNATINYNYTGE